MAVARTARLVAREASGEGALLRFAMATGEPLGFRGGQYVIVDTGLDLPDGKRRKRAYTLCSSEADQVNFELGVYPVENGLGAAYMLALGVGAELRFSGPWGKLVPPAVDAERVWLLATDTGITAALGLVRGAGYAQVRARTCLCWWTASPSYFLSRAAVAERVPEGMSLRHMRLPLPGSPERPQALRAQLAQLLSEGRPTAVYVTGDGQMPGHVHEFLDAHGLGAVPLQSENFFHHPVRKAAPTQAG